eukprot:2267132-Rhodomonas_salina.1
MPELALTSITLPSRFNSLRFSLSAAWIVWICCDTAESTSGSRRLNSSKQPHAPHLTNPVKMRPMDLKSIPSSHSSWTVRVASVPKVQALGQGKVALVRQGRVHQLRVVSLILVRVLVLCVAHAQHALAVLVVVPKLLVPVPLLRAVDLVLLELVQHINVVDDVQDDGLELQRKYGILHLEENIDVMSACAKPHHRHTFQARRTWPKEVNLESLSLSFFSIAPTCRDLKASSVSLQNQTCSAAQRIIDGNFSRSKVCKQSVSDFSRV